MVGLKLIRKKFGEDFERKNDKIKFPFRLYFLCSKNIQIADHHHGLIEG